MVPLNILTQDSERVKSCIQNLLVSGAHQPLPERIQAGRPKEQHCQESIAVQEHPGGVASGTRHLFIKNRLTAWYQPLKSWYHTRSDRSSLFSNKKSVLTLFHSILQLSQIGGESPEAAIEFPREIVRQEFRKSGDHRIKPDSLKSCPEPRNHQSKF